MKKINRQPSSSSFFFSFSNIIIIPFLLQPANGWVPPPVDFEVGVITVEMMMMMGTLEAGTTTKKLQTTIAMAVSDFYALHSHFKTRLRLLHFRDSKRNPPHLLSSVADLLKNSEELRAILILRATSKSQEPAADQSFMDEFGKIFRIPVISQAVEVDGIASPVKSDADDGETDRPTACLWAYYLVGELAGAAEEVGTIGYYNGSLGKLWGPVGEFSRLEKQEKVKSSIPHDEPKRNSTSTAKKMFPIMSARFRPRRLVKELDLQSSVGADDDENETTRRSFSKFVKKTMMTTNSSHNRGREHHDVTRNGQGGVPKRLRVGVPVGEPGFDELFKVHVHSPPNSSSSSSLSTVTVSGFCVDVFKSAIHRLPYEVSFDFVPFAVHSTDAGIWPSYYGNLIYQVHLQRFDTAVADIIITANDSDYVDFTLPYTDLGLGVVARKRDEKSPWIFTRPLTAALWGTMAGFLVWVGFVVWVIERPVSSDFRGSVSQ